MFTSHPDSRKVELDSASGWGWQNHVVKEQMGWEILLWQSLGNTICHIQIIYTKTLWTPENYGHIHSYFTFFLNFFIMPPFELWPIEFYARSDIYLMSRTQGLWQKMLIGRGWAIVLRTLSLPALFLHSSFFLLISFYYSYFLFIGVLGVSSSSHFWSKGFLMNRHAWFFIAKD